MSPFDKPGPPRVDTALLEHVMVDYASEGQTDHVNELIGRLLTGPAVAFAATMGMFAACVSIVAEQSPGSEPALYGLTISEKAEAAMVQDEYFFARRATVQAFVAALNNDYPMAGDLIAPHLTEISGGVTVFMQALAIWGGIAAEQMKDRKL